MKVAGEPVLPLAPTGSGRLAYAFALGPKPFCGPKGGRSLTNDLEQSGMLRFVFLKLPMFTCRALMVGLLPAAARNRHSPRCLQVPHLQCGAEVLLHPRCTRMDLLVPRGAASSR